MTSTTTPSPGDTYQIGDHAFPTTPQIGLLRHYVEWVEAQAALPDDERQWDQSGWVNDCGTAYCLAGKVAIDHHPDYQRGAWSKVGGCEMHISEFAARTLGLAPDGHPHGDVCLVIQIFSERNSAADIRRLAEEIAGDHPDYRAS